MKKRCGFCLLLALSLLFAGCGAGEVTTDTPPAAENEQTYLSQIAELEAQLAKQREEKFISDSAYKAKIAELEGRLALLCPDTESSTEQEGGEELIFTYRLENGKAIITGYQGAATLVTVPAVLDGYPVVAIGERAFEGTKVAAVTLPDGMEAVGWFAFYGCTMLLDVTIPASVTSIGYAVFDGCEHVTIIGTKDSYAAQYAKSYGLPFVSV